MPLLLLLLACVDEPALLTSGTYVLDFATDGSGERLEADTIGDAELVIDKEGATADLTATDGDDVYTVTFALFERSRADWRTACHTNYSSVRIETIDTDADELVVGPLTIATPVLTGDCDGAPVLAAADGDDIGEPAVYFVAE